MRDDDGGDLHVAEYLPVHREGPLGRSPPAERAGTFEPRRDEALTLAERAADPVGQPGLLDEDRGVPRDFAKRRVRHRDDRSPGRHGLEDGEPEALVPARLDETRGAAIEIGEPLRIDVALEPGAVLVQLRRELRILRRPDDDEREPGSLRGLQGRELVLPALNRSDRQTRSRAPPVPGRKTGSTPFGVTTIRSAGTPYSSRMSAFVRSDTVRTRAAFRTARGTTRRKTMRSFRPMSPGSRANETSCTVTM